MTLRHMQIFEAVCAENSITAAADRLYMTQPAVSRAVKELEGFYGVRLFERMNRRLYITPAGSRLREYAGAIISRFNESVGSLRNTDALSLLKVGVNVTIGEALLPGVLKSFGGLYPDVSVLSVVENSKQIEDLLQKNEIDLAVVDNVTVSPYFITEILFREKMAVLCAPGYTDKETMTPEELAGEKLLLREKGSGTRDSTERIFASGGFRISPVMESISPAALIGAAVQGLGITVLSPHTAKKELADGSLKQLRIKNTKFPRDYFVVYHKSKLVTSVMKNFIALLSRSASPAG